MKDDDIFCRNCGKKVENATPHLGGTLALAPSVTTPELLIGGFASSDMLRPGSIGYGIYITDRRVIGVKRPDQFVKSVGGAVAGAVIGKALGYEAPWTISSALGQSLSGDENTHLLVEIEAKKDFEAYKQDISLIQLKSPGLISPGQFAIFLRGEKLTNIAVSLRTQTVFEKLKKMFQSSYPQVLRILA